ncbi:serine-rich adhesin for platelets [Biomphalaria glabrata]|nr:serine-rich adhesin for platelets [Biomphalaria glabrata]
MHTVNRGCIYCFVWTIILRNVAGQCPSGCSQCVPGDIAVCASVCPSKVQLPTDITTYVQTGRGACNVTPTWLLQTDDFIPYTNLQNVSITHSNVISLDNTDPPFEHLKNLKSISLAHNIFRTIDKQFINLTTLEDLDLSYNFIGIMQDRSLSSLIYLKSLNLEHNRINSLSSEKFSGLDSLQNLVLSHNPISSIDTDTFQQLQNIETIELQDAQIKSIDSGWFHGLTRLKHIDLSNNSISSINDDSFVGTALDDLDLSYNHLTSVPVTAIQRSSQFLIKLSLAHNQIASISNSDLKDFTFGTLDLSDNQITHISKDLFDNVNIVETIDLSGNPITNIDYGALTQLQLAQKLVDLSNTNLMSLPRSTENWLASTFTTVNLNNTNWQCDCAMLWFARITSKGNIVSPTCAASTKYAGQLVSAAVQQLEKDCMTTTTKTTRTTPPKNNKLTKNTATTIKDNSKITITKPTKGRTSVSSFTLTSFVLPTSTTTETTSALSSTAKTSPPKANCACDTKTASTKANESTTVTTATTTAGDVTTTTFTVTTSTLQAIFQTVITTTAPVSAHTPTTSVSTSTTSTLDLNLKHCHP